MTLVAILYTLCFVIYIDLYTCFFVAVSEFMFFYIGPLCSPVVSKC